MDDVSGLDPSSPQTPAPEGTLAQNILHFARALRAAGLPVGPGAVLDAVRAVEIAGVRHRSDFRATLEAVFVSKREHLVVFDAAFRMFWKRRGFLEKLIAMMSPLAEPQQEEQQKASKPEAGSTRVAQALMPQREPKEIEQEFELDQRFTVSASELLQKKDFAQMTAEEIAAAMRAIDRLDLSDNEVRTRRFVADARGARIDLRRSLRRSLRAGGATIDLARRSPAVRHPPIVAICDISGSMSDYTRVFLHFLHALTNERRQVQTFLFGTRLTNVTRALRYRDPDEALSQCSLEVADWSGGTRIGSCLHRFNRDWSRRVLGQGAIVLLFTDGLEREGTEELAREMERLHKSSRRLIWLNPLLRFDRFEARALGIRAMLPHVDEFRPVHNLSSIAQLCEALSAHRLTASIDPKRWLKRAA
ncbi:VWA domain-containing protein [Methylocella sp. CPCC 101449]|uniref:vWA domain-containing protein n=1 Tax=Methylocella sp. CPCC 101449 TaxID=2987531 RepID=UPI00288D5608|nr:VWA domain-containing protein [Methylocella sp. CPCC 101449]MDT2023436.1 VWA domain-containing protein [Methylocella sp. CPCC 101449]HEV2574026.1 VWA domain-containing protein [Beijerinckiaceae bacterium]